MRCFACLFAVLALASTVWAEDAPKTKPIEALNPVSRPNDWWTSRHQQKLDEIKKADKIDVVFIGDSITHGWENAGKATWEEEFAPLHPLNLGYGGDRTEHVLWRFENGELDGYEPKVAVIMIGTNNTGHRMEKSEDTAAGVEAIVEKLHEKHPETKVLLLAIFPRDATVDGAKRKLNDGANEILEKEMKDKDYVTFLNINDVFLTEDGTLTKEIMPDLLHPKQKGYKLWADAISDKVKELLGE
ncbi:platelet-activating factor acetylhydrolase IB subunit [Blastopirellula marina]|uniref:Acetylglucosamine-6-sulfatase n=1 Tax=Blastopirellula marina TaxID=124 RepID=A0A2S8GD81_9BACT|nr:platelet-activating factor acetylhydrolase IB subunit [Blastopirellula marina]PQO42201.1 acetylglucosamine-6-sulfatase [Blastopirellula marina]